MRLYVHKHYWFIKLTWSLLSSSLIFTPNSQLLRWYLSSVFFFVSFLYILFLCHLPVHESLGDAPVHRPRVVHALCDQERDVSAKLGSKRKSLKFLWWVGDISIFRRRAMQSVFLKKLLHSCERVSHVFCRALQNIHSNLITHITAA